MWGRMLGLSYFEYSSMPLGELNDMISAYIIIQNPEAEEKKQGNYIPNLK